MRARILFLALLIALLPLRGWVGDAMAMERTAAALAQTAEHSLMVDMADHHADCHGHAATVNAHAEAAPPSMADDCGSCTACQICHTLALTPVSLTSVPSPHLAGHPDAPVITFSSAERAPGFKPPIS